MVYHIKRASYSASVQLRHLITHQTYILEHI